MLLAEEMLYFVNSFLKFDIRFVTVKW